MTYNQEVGKGGGDAAKGAPEEKDLCPEVGVAFAGTNQVRGDDGNDLSGSVSQLSSKYRMLSTYAIPEPVGRGRDANTARSDRKREDLSDNHPRTRAPCGREEGDVEADEGNHSGNSSVVVFRGLAGGNPNDTDDELHDDHPCASDDEDLAATEALDCPKGDGSRADVDKGCDERDEERVADRAQGGEENGSKVEDEVDTGQLLHHLHEDT